MCKKCSTCKEEKLFSEFSKNKTKKDGYQNECKVCVKHHREVNKEYFSQYKKNYRETNKKQIAEKQKQYRKTNQEHVAEYNKQYQKNNYAKINAKNAKRRAKKLQATPSWLTHEELQQIEEFYKEAQALKLSTGKEYHVDHIVPLQGDVVCGLHVPWNLQVLEALENRSKSNKLDK